jgi:hypothetical protein
VGGGSAWRADRSPGDACSKDASSPFGHDGSDSVIAANGAGRQRGRGRGGRLRRTIGPRRRQTEAQQAEPTLPKAFDRVQIEELATGDFIRRCSQKRSTALVTNVYFDKWEEYLVDGPLAMALLDRLVERAIILKIKGKTYRTPLVKTEDNPT